MTTFHYYAHMTPMEMVEPLQKAFLCHPALQVTIEEGMDEAHFTVSMRHRRQFYIVTIDAYLHAEVTLKSVTEGDYYAEITFAPKQGARDYLDYTLLGTITLESDEEVKVQEKIFDKIVTGIASELGLKRRPEGAQRSALLADDASKPLSFTLFVQEIIGRGAVTDSEVTTLRHMAYKDHTVELSELTALYDIDKACAQKSAIWNDFFSDAIVDHYLHRGVRSTVLTRDEAHEILQRIESDTRQSDKLKLLVTLKVVENSEGLPDALKNGIYDKIFDNVMSSCDPLFSKKARFAGAIDADDLKAIRMVIFGRGGDDSMSVSRREAELLIKLDMATDPLKNHPDWPSLYTKALAMYLLHGGDTPGSIDAAEASWYMDMVGHTIRTPAQRALQQHLKTMKVPLHSLLLQTGSSIHGA